MQAPRVALTAGRGCISIRSVCRSSPASSTLHLPSPSTRRRFEEGVRLMPESYRLLAWTGSILLLAFARLAFGGPAPTDLAPHTPFTPPAALAAQPAPPGAMIEPLALQILKRMGDSLRRATSFAF